MSVTNIFSTDIPKPFIFIDNYYKSDLSSIITELNALLPQFSDFIDQFNNVVNQTGINVITDSAGNMSIDVPKNMTDSVANSTSTRIGILDRLISTRGQEISDLIQKGSELENKLKFENSNYISQLSDKISEYNRLKSTYKH